MLYCHQVWAALSRFNWLCLVLLECVSEILVTRLVLSLIYHSPLVVFIHLLVAVDYTDFDSAPDVKLVDALIVIAFEEPSDLPAVAALMSRVLRRVLELARHRLLFLVDEPDVY